MSRRFLWGLALALWTLAVAYALRAWAERRPPPQLERAAPALLSPCRVTAEDFHP